MTDIQRAIFLYKHDGYCYSWGNPLDPLFRCSGNKEEQLAGKSCFLREVCTKNGSSAVLIGLHTYIVEHATDDTYNEIMEMFL